MKNNNYVFRPSIQGALFNYLKPEQKEYVRPYLRVLKKEAQEELCCMLLDYMETGDVVLSSDVVVAGMFIYLTRYRMPEGDVKDAPIIRPLHRCHRQPQSIGTLINSMFKKITKNNKR